MQNVLSSKTLFIIWIISWGASFIVGGIISDAFRTLGTIVLIFSIIAFFREKKDKKVNQDLE